MAKHPVLRALVLGLTLIAAACGGGEDGVATDATPAAGDDSVEETADTEHDDAAMTDEADADAGADDAGTDAPADSEESSAPAGGPPPSLPPEEAQAAAEQNIPNLGQSDDVRDIEVVSVYDGSITSLREVATGDRPVLVWFWAPH